MKTIETQLFSFNELSEEAQEKVIEAKASDILNDPDNFTLDEAVDSLKKIVEATGAKLTDWQIGPYYHGTRASASYEVTFEEFRQVLLDHGYPQGVGQVEFPGTCGFTGVCFDEDVAQTIHDELRDGETFSQAVNAAADKIRQICEDDLEWRASKEGILEYLDRDEEIYTEDGSEF